MSSSSASETDRLLKEFAGYLRRERGVSMFTVDLYVADVRRFLADHGNRELRELSPAEVSRSVLDQVGAWSPASVRRFGCALRSFLRYCFVTGLVERDLSGAALPVSGRRRSLLPQGIILDYSSGDVATTRTPQLVPSDRLGELATGGGARLTRSSGLVGLVRPGEAVWAGAGPGHRSAEGGTEATEGGIELFTPWPGGIDA